MSRRKLSVVVVCAAAVIAAAILIWAQRNANPLPSDFRADKVLVEKSARRLSLLRGGQVVKSYRVALGRAPVGQKEREGDKRTPEGVYVIDRHKVSSGYHKAMHISYPTAEQRAHAAKAGIDPGSDIMIHGLRNWLGWMGAMHRGRDWTLGCIAVTNAEVDEIYRAVADGTPIEILP